MESEHDWLKLLPIQLELHIGYVYGASKPPPHASYYSPKFVPGARLPHAWISFPDQPSSTTINAKLLTLPREPVDVSYVKELSKDQIQACQWSTLDLCAPDSWTLILGQGQEDSQATSLQKHCHTIGISLYVWRLGVDFELVRQYWFADELRNGGILVRPDQHILTRVALDMSREGLIAQLNKHLGI